jgi:hypothetical protein
MVGRCIAYDLSKELLFPVAFYYVLYTLERKNYGMAINVERIIFSTSDNNAVN